MNTNLFERKSFLEEGWMTNNTSNCFSRSYSGQNLILTIDLHRASANEAESLKKYLTMTPIKNVTTAILDFSSCSFIDSTFLNTVIGFRKRSNLEIKLVVSNKRQLTLFKITRLNSIFKIYTSLEQALA